MELVGDLTLSTIRTKLVQRSFVVSSTRSFDFTQSFEDGILGLLPATCLLVFGSFRLLQLRRRRIVVLDSRRKWESRWALLLLSALTLALVIVQAIGQSARSDLAITATAVSFVCTAMLVWLSSWEYARSVRPSPLVTLFLLLTISFDAARARTYWLKPTHTLLSTIFTLTLVLKILALGLELRSKRAYLHSFVRHRSLEQTASAIGLSFWTWLNGFLYRGFRKGLSSLSDLPSIDETLLAPSLRQCWQSSERGTKLYTERYGLIRRTLRAIGLSFWTPILARLCMTAFTYTQPLLLERVIGYVNDPESSDDIGYGLMGAYFLVYTGLAVSSALYGGGVNRITTKCRGLLVHAISQKVLDVDASATSDMNAVTLMSTDTQRIADGIKYIHELWATVLEAGLALFLLQRQVGALAMAPIVIALGCAACSAYLARLAAPRSAAWLRATQERLRLTIPIITSMKEVKLLGLTGQASEWITSSRANEVDISNSYRRLMICTTTLAYATMTLAPVAVFTGFSAISVSSRKTLDASRAFSSLSLINLLATPLIACIQSLPVLTSTFACFTRIQDFLNSDERLDPRGRASHEILRTLTDLSAASGSQGEELRELPRQTGSAESAGACPEIRFDHASLAWSPILTPCLHNINISILPGSFNVIVGPSGSGKSAFLRSVLGELSLLQGTVHVKPKDIAFADQNTWIRNISLKANILGASCRPVDSDLLIDVVHACALDEDFGGRMMAADLLAGSKGVNISGGQKQRVAIARAVYAQKRLILLDDVLSGLDTITEAKVLRRLFGPTGLLRQSGSTTMMTSHSLQSLKQADNIIVLSQGGSIAEQGPFDDLKLRAGYVQDLVKARLATNRIDRSKPSVVLAPTAAKKLVMSNTATSSVSSAPTPSKRSVYFFYLGSLGAWNTMTFAVLGLVFVVCLRFPDLWLSWWSKANAEKPNKDLGRYLGVYATLQICTLMSLFLWIWSYFTTGATASGIFMHQKVLKTTISAAMVFFNTVDQGVTTNRFSQDLQLIDRDLPNAFLNSVESILSAFAQVALIAFASAYVCVLYPILAVALYMIQRFYLTTSRPLRILDIEAKAPLYTHFVEVLEGVVTIRAFGWQQDMQEEHDQLLDISQKPFYLLLSIQRWLNLVLDLLVGGLAVTVVGLIVPLRHTLNPGYIGVALSNLITLGGTLRELIVWWTTLETSIGAATRIKSFSEETPAEGANDTDMIPPKSWPDGGAVEISDVSATYATVPADASPALEAISLMIQPGQRVGIVGRSGSGKSTLLGVLFRLLESTSGRITIDGIPISAMPRESLRTHLNIVPQLPFFVTGNVRLNLDPWCSCSDETKLWDALDAVQLSVVVRQNGGLDTALTDRMLSHGQKQLFCLARAMLRPGKLLVLDEAMSAVDAETDERMQRILSEHFCDHTILAVAHRLDWVRKVDMVVVMEQGRIKECGTPMDLLDRPDGEFAKLSAAYDG